MVIEEKFSAEVSWVDTVVICALEVEFQAISSRLRHHPEFPTDTGLGLSHFIALEGKGLTILVVRLPDPGAGNVISGIIAAFLISRYDPWLLISFGIAGTLDPEEVRIYDVLYSQAVFYLDLRKETKKGLVLKRTVQRETPMPLLILLRALKVEGYKLHEAVIVTGEAVVKDEKANLRRIAGNAISDAKAVEMESFGVFQASHVDEKFLTGTSRFCLAIKSISDAADPDKSDAPHELASHKAANFLSILLNADLEAVRKKSSNIDSRPRPLQPFIRRPPREALARVNIFSDIVKPLADASWDKSALQAVHMRCRRPRVFYHWRLTGMGLHWVELKFLLVLRRLAKNGYPVECLVADMILPMSNSRLTEAQLPAAHEATLRIVNALLDRCPGSSTIFYSEVGQIEELLSGYAGRAGYWREVRELLAQGNLGNLPNTLDNGSRLNSEFNEWLQYITWRTRHEGVSIILHHRVRNIYSLLSWFSSHLPALVPTIDIQLAGRWGKFELPGCDLFLLPPDSPDIVRWLNETSSLESLEEFWHHLIAQDDLTEETLIRNRQVWGRAGSDEYLPRQGDSSWIEAFLANERAKPEYYKGAVMLELAWLNQEFFSSFRKQPTE
jgi:nucleoside phosphorylase